MVVPSGAMSKYEYGGWLCSRMRRQRGQTLSGQSPEACEADELIAPFLHLVLVFDGGKGCIMLV
jgi:hypothetical protein